MSIVCAEIHSVAHLLMRNNFHFCKTKPGILYSGRLLAVADPTPRHRPIGLVSCFDAFWFCLRHSFG